MADANMAIGIDGGTHNSCVAATRNGAVEVIESAEGSRTTASCVAFTDTERLVGDSARRQGPENAANTIFGAKRILGMNFDDPILQEYRKNLPFKLVSDRSGRAQIEVVCDRKRIRYFPEQILQM
ncbi:heat shock protein 70 B2, partial [Aphelenchoides avenae]